ncbi:MAG: inner membrane protein YhjD [Actinomycetota bacterium]|nr:inner membrane protein YhjD [Actinomycetota bacterium]
MTAPSASDSDDKPGLMDRLRARMPWFDHVMRAQERYNSSKGDFYAAGITYYTIFALFPLLMVGFAIGGFVLASRPELLLEIENQIRANVSGDLGRQLIELMEAAIESRTSVGIIGLATAAWAGLGWMNNLREALSQMWGLFREERPGFVKTKLSDLVALVSLFVASVFTLALTALGNTTVIEDLLHWFGFRDSTVLSVVLRVASIAISILVSWLLFTYVIARLPRESVSFRSSMRAGLIVAVAFEVFKLVASIYLRSVLTGPAGATFGPVLGLMVFAYITARLVLFSTAWAATLPENMADAALPAPGPAVINNRIITRPGLQPWQAAAAAAAGALGVLTFSRWRRR